jgi:hypothetical protein
MEWAGVAILTAIVAYLSLRVRRLERDLRSLHLRWHDAASRAMRRHRRERYFRRQVDGILRIVCRETLPGLDVPDLLEGPPDDPDTPTGDSDML